MSYPKVTPAYPTVITKPWWLSEAQQVNQLNFKRLNKIEIKHSNKFIKKKGFNKKQTFETTNLVR